MGIAIDRVFAKARDHDFEQEKLELLSSRYLANAGSGEPYAGFSGQEIDFALNKEGKGCRLPIKFAKAMFPEIFGAKALPSTSTGGAGETSLYQGELERDAFQYLGEPAVIYPRATKVPAKGGTALVPQVKQAAPGQNAEGTLSEFAEYGYAAFGWSAEGAQYGGSEAQFSQASIPVFTLTGQTQVSRHLLAIQEINLVGILGQLFRAAMLHKIDEALIGGDGNSKPQGVLNASSVATVNRATMSHVKYADILAMYFSIPPQLRSMAAWVMADGALQDLIGQLDSNNRPIFLANPGQGSLGTIMGPPVLPSQRPPALGNTGDVMLGYWPQYCVGIETDISILSSEHRYIDSCVIGFFVFCDVGGKVLQPRCFVKLV